MFGIYPQYDLFNIVPREKLIVPEYDMEMYKIMYKYAISFEVKFF